MEWMAIALLTPIGMLVLWIVSLNQDATQQMHMQVEERPKAHAESGRKAA